MGCLQSKDKGYSVPDLQSNEINNPMKDASGSDKNNSPDKFLSPKELLMQKKREVDEDTSLLDQPTSILSHSENRRCRSASDDISEPVQATRSHERKLSVSELLLQEKMKKKNDGASVLLNHEEGKEGWLYRQNEDALDNEENFIKLWAILTDRKLFYYKNKPANDECLNDFSALGCLDFRAENKAECKMELKNKANSEAFWFKIRESGISISFASLDSNDRDEWVYKIQESIRGVNFKRNGSGQNSRKTQKRSKFLFEVVELPKMEGQLKKMSGQNSKFKVSKLDTRWFRLEAGELKYYADQSLKISKHTKIMSLKAARLSEGNEGVNIHVQFANGHHLQIVASSDVTASEWRNAIGSTIAMLAEAEKDTNGGKKRRADLANIQGGNASSRQCKKVYKSSDSKDIIMKALKKHFMLSGLTDFMYTPILDALQLEVALPGDIVIWQHSIGDLFYVLEKGQVEVIKNHLSVTVLPSGTAFGELALINDIARTATIRAHSVCYLWYIDRKTLRHVLSTQFALEKQRKIDLLRNVPLFQKLNTKFGQIADVMNFSTYEKDERVIKQGEPGDYLYMIQSGSVKITKEGVRSTELGRLSAGSSFGELALQSNDPRSATVTALEKLNVYTIDKPTFNSVLGELSEAEVESMGVEILNKVELLRGLSERQLGVISKNLTTESFSDGEVIIRQGEEGDTFYMISEGAVNVCVNHVDVAKLTVGQYFGELALMNDDRRNATITAIGDVICLTLGRNEFIELLGPLDELLRAEEERREKMTKKSGIGGRLRSISKSLFHRDGSKSSDSMSRELEFALNDFEDIRILGRGRFGCVKLVKHKLTKVGYAMKYSQKEALVELQNQQSAIDEKKILSELDHPFIAALFATFQTSDCLVFLLEMLHGGDSWSAMYDSRQDMIDLGQPTAHGGLSFRLARFYFCNVFAALSYLHEQNVIYRDLKPENLVLERTGYLKLVDFGCAKRVSSDAVTNTICGTPEYVAPEMILARGHNKGVDYWTLGIFLFELLTRRTPFVTTDAAGVYMKILKPEESLLHAFDPVGDVEFDAEAKDLILRLLDPNPGLRIGMRRGETAEIWDHPFVSELSLNEVMMKSIDAPVKPEVCDIFEKTFLDYEDVDDGIVPYRGKNDIFSSF